MTEDLHTAGFKDRTRLGAAREQLLSRVTPHARSESVPVTDADGRALAESVTAGRPVPHYPRAAMDGYAVRAEDTFGASARSPVVLRRGDDAAPGTAVRVHTGSELPPDANAVVMIEQVEEVGPELEVFDAVAEGENVGAVGEDVADGQVLFDPPHELRPSDLGLLKSTGVSTVAVQEPPRVAVIPTGEELVQSDPAPGEIVETNGQTVSQLVARWGGVPSYRDVVTDDEEELRAAIEGDTDHDLVVTTGGSSVGERDLVPEVVATIGEVFVHGVALKPGHPVALGVVE
ncbi:MAG: molybdopterin molybdotransferase MoeA, partial [Halobacteriales archaeon]|nr:molybdopterin molybdotransferase MoeA [Halobacteriales archaeon]